MTSRREFMEALAGRTRALPAEEQARLAAYFGDMIDDRVAMGMPEADAVAALGDPDALLRDVCPERDDPAALAALPGGAEYMGVIREIRLHLRNADGRILRGELPDGMAARIEATEARRFQWQLAEGALTVTEAEPPRRGLFRREAGLVITLCGFEPEVLIADSYGGDIAAEGFSPTVRAVLASSSGDIALQRFGCAGRMEITTRSGDISLREIDARADCKLETLSGDIEIESLSAGSLRARTASGDIDGRALNAGSIALGASSGDVELDSAAAESTLMIETASGDIDLARVAAPDIRLSAASGDVDLSLAPRGGGYSIEASSRSGDVQTAGHAPGGSGRVRVQTVSGDIHISVG